MRYEIAHDSLARQILDRVSGEAKARRQAELLVARAYDRYLERQVLLTQEDLDEIRPHEKTINFSPEETRFIQESKMALARAARRKRQILIGVITLLSLFLLFALWQWQRSVAGTKALRAKAAYENGYISQAFRLAQSAYHTMGVDDDTKNTVREVLQDIHNSGLERDLLHSGNVKTFDLDPKEEYILSTTDGQMAYIWDLQGRLLHTLEHPAELLDGRFLPWDTNRASVTIAADSTAYFWNGSGKSTRKYHMNEPIKGFDLNEQLRLILLWSEQEIVLLDDSGKVWPFAPGQSGFINAAFSPNGNDLLLVTRDSVSSWWLQLVKISRPQPRLIIPGPVRWANYIASDQVQLQVLVQFMDSTSRVFDNQGNLDTVTFYKYLNRELKLLPFIERFDFSPPGTGRPKTLFQTDSVSARYWSAYRKDTEGDRAGEIDFYTRYDLRILTTTFSSSGRYLLTASADGRVDIWDIEERIIERYKRIRAQIRSARFAHNDNYLITSAQDRTIKIWKPDRTGETGTKEILEFYDSRIQDFP